MALHLSFLATLHILFFLRFGAAFTLMLCLCSMPWGCMQNIQKS